MPWIVMFDEWGLYRAADYHNLCLFTIQFQPFLFVFWLNDVQELL